MTVSSYTIPNLIQGVSQQAPEQRRATQVEAETNCVNSPKDGLLSRGGADFMARFALNTGSYAAFHEVFRNEAEHYLVVVPHKTAASSGEVRVFNLASGGTECTVTGGTGQSYLDLNPSDGTREFSFQTVDDHTFIANGTKTVAMTSAVQSTRPPEALVFIKAGSYSQTYMISIVHGGNKYTWAYKTPDNSVAGNADYISTAQIAATFYRALTGTAAPIHTSGNADAGVGVRGMFAGDVGGVGGSTVTGAITATSIGFSVDIRGNVLRIWRGSDSNAFSIDCGDSVGNTFMVALKDKARSLSDLPERGFPGFRLKIAGVSNESQDDYHVEYSADGEVWQECAGAGVNTTLDAAKMPHALINTGLNTFTFGAVTWNTRLVGDDTTAPLPYFVGQKIKALFYHQERLGILTEGAYDLSKARNVFNFFRDTVQTVLASDPISSPVSGSQSISLLSKVARIDESLFLWAQRAQYRLTGGADGFRPESIENKLSTSYEFSPLCGPVAVGPSLYFATDGEQWASVRNIVYGGGGRAAPAIDVTSHVPEYIPAGVHTVAASDSMGMLYVLSDGELGTLFHYSYVVQGTEVVQSAWNKWTFPFPMRVRWASEYRGTLYLALVDPTVAGRELILCSLPLRTSTVDPGEAYLTRLDLRVSEAQTTETYDGVNDRTTITLPYRLDDININNLRAVFRTGSFRGNLIPIVSKSGFDLVVSGNVTSQAFYVGTVINSQAQLSQFYPRLDGGEAVFADDLKVGRLLLSYTNACSFKVRIVPAVGSTVDTDFAAAAQGVAEAGTQAVPVLHRSDQYTATLINDSVFPCAWQRLQVYYETVNRGESDSRAGAGPDDTAVRELRQDMQRALERAQSRDNEIIQALRAELRTTKDAADTSVQALRAELRTTKDAMDALGSSVRNGMEQALGRIGGIGARLTEVEDAARRRPSHQQGPGGRGR